VRGLIERIQENRQQRVESRVIGGTPWTPWLNPFNKFSAGGPLHPSRSYYGEDAALALPALYSGVSLLANSIASLPLKIYTRATGSGHPARYQGPSLFDHPSVDGTLFDWLFTAMTSLLLQGNAWGFITSRDGYGFPQGIEWIPPQDVSVMDDEMQPWNPLRSRIYVYGRLMDRRELFHIKAFALAGRTEGISPLRAFATTILAGLEAQRYGTSWYQAGGFPPGTFQNSEIEIDADQAEEIRAMLSSTIQRRQPLVYGRDWDYKPVTVPPNEAQFIEAIRLNASQVAAFLHLPPDRIGGTRGDSLTYATVEQSTLQVIEALRPWLVRLETAFYDIMPANRYCRFDSDALLKTDLKTRTDIYKTQRDMGLRTTDEIRDLEDMEPLPGKAGSEFIPLEVMVAMSRSIRGIPNSMLSSITLEMDLAAKKLEDLQHEGLAQPDILGQPVVPPTSQMLGQIIASQRSLDPDERADAGIILDWLASRNGGHRPQAPPEYIGAWIPARQELVNGRKSVMDVALDTWTGRGMPPPDRIARAEILAGALFGRGRDSDPAGEDLTREQYQQLCDLIRRNPPLEQPALAGAGAGAAGASGNSANGYGGH
jgi:HK97 family phage portal protein